MGGVRTALYNYLFAKANGGKFILRIEDTDQSRFVKGAEDYIVEALKWCGLTLDEGEGIGGEFGPYKQSLRSDLYNKAVAYFQAFSEGDLDALGELYANNIYLRDWEGTYVGAMVVLGANKQLFDNVDALAVRIIALHCDEDARTIAAEVEIMIPDSDPLLVVDVIEFNSEGLISSIRAYKG